VILFGSCARGDHEVGSDIDVFILVREKNIDTVKLINSLSDSIDWKYDTLIANIIRSCDIYDQYKNDSLYMRIRQEGKVYYGAA
jgi:predicted nucleotidyltransferase